MWDSVLDMLKDFVPIAGPLQLSQIASELAQTDPAELARRKQVIAGLTLSHIPEVAEIQKQAQLEYLRTGVWNPKYTEEANKYRDRIAGIDLPKGLAGPLVAVLIVALIAIFMRR